MIFTLIGMPGCGKSCMGRFLSRKLKIDLIDSDKLIEENANKNLNELIKEIGNDGFRKLEEETLLSIDKEDCILSTGGSAVYSDAAMKHLKKKGKLIYLYCSYPVIKDRLGDFSKRGVIMGPDQTLKDLYDERTALYKKYADIIISCDGNEYSSYQSSLLMIIKRYL